MSDFNNTYPRKQFERDSFFAIKDGWTLNDKAINLPYPKNPLFLIIQIKNMKTNYYIKLISHFPKISLKKVTI